MVTKPTRVASPLATPARARWVLIGMTLTLLAAIATSAWAQPAPPPESGRPHMHGMRHDGGGMMGPGLFRGSPERMGRMIDRMLDGLNASDAQRSQIKQIAAAAAADVRAQMQAGRGLRQRGAQALLAPNVDAAGVEQSRQQMLQQHEQTSRRVSQALVEIARVLTPEQRARAAERLRDLQARMDERRQRMERRGPPR